MNRRASSTKSDLIPENCEELGTQMVRTVIELMRKYDIPKECVLNADETPPFMETNPNYTLDEKGKRGPTTVLSFNKEKQRINFMLTITSNGDHLKPFVVLKGKNVKLLVKNNKDVLKNSIVCANKNTWMTTKLTKYYIKRVIKPYAKGEYYILLRDHFSCHYRKEIIDLCLQYKIIVVLIPARCTPMFQPLDVSVNKSLKNYIRRSCEEFKISQLICNDIDDDITLTAPHRNNIILQVYSYIENDKTGESGFKKIGFNPDDNEFYDDVHYEAVFEKWNPYSLQRNLKKITNTT